MARRVLIIGGGAGGTMLANALDRRRFEVTVVSASAEHLFQPALLYVAFAGDRSWPVRDERRLLARHVRFVHDAVTRIDLGAHTVTTASGGRLDGDVIVVATGIRTDPGQIPGLAETVDRFGDYHSTVDRARRLWASLQDFEGGTIALGQSTAICKCPPSPAEGILLADRLLRRRGLRERSRLVFFTPYPRAYPAPAMSEIVEPIFARRGIELRTFFDVDRIDPATRTISSIEGDDIHYDLPIVIPPFVGVDIAYEPATVLDENRFVRTDRATLRIEGADDAYAIGDATNLPTSKSGVGAHLQAKVVAEALAGRPARFGGRTHCPLDTGDGRGTFVRGSFEAPVVKSPPTRLKHLMKMAFGRVYWLSLRGWLEPLFTVYFRVTEPTATPQPGAKAPAP